MEKNRKYLYDSLQKLPVYKPQNSLWTTINLKLEHTPSLNKHLTTYDPPENIWKNIDDELTKSEKVPALTNYSAPEKIWEKIEKDLQSDFTRSSKKVIYRWLAWSSSIAAILIAGLFIVSTVYNNNSYIYSEEWVNVEPTDQWNDDEIISVEQTLTVICQENPISCNTPEFRKLEKELSFLTDSKQEIIDQLNRYSTNSELEILLTEIEIERSSLIKEMISIII